LVVGTPPGRVTHHLELLDAGTMSLVDYLCSTEHDGFLAMWLRRRRRRILADTPEYAVALFLRARPPAAKLTPILHGTD